MQVQWREKEYSFRPSIIKAGKDKGGSGTKTIVDKNIYAFDTESVALPDRYEPQCFQLSRNEKGEDLIYLPPFAKALEHFVDHYVKLCSWEDFEKHYALMYAHNLSYDWLQLIKHYPDLVAMARTGLGIPEDYTIYKTNDYKVKLKKNALFTGSAPFFSLKIEMSKREWVELMFRDTFSYFPSTLARLAKDLGLEVDKMERQSDIGQRDFRPEAMSEDKAYFEKYAKMDAYITRLAGERIRELHINAEMKRIRASAPSFAIAYLYHHAPEGTVIRTGCSDEKIMQLVLDCYAGGRTGGIYHGQIENVSVLDFHSSYPASMVSLPSFSPTMEYISYPNLEHLTEDDIKEIIKECHCFMRIDGEELDAKYPSIIMSKNKKLTPVYGKFENMASTGVEIAVGLNSGTLKITKVRELVCLIETVEPDCLPFKDFALGAYDRKAKSEKGSSEYVSSKLVINGGYGKLIESRTETPVNDEVKDIVLPYIDGMETEFGQQYYKEFIESLGEESTTTFIQRYPNLVEEIVNEFKVENLQFATFGKLSLTKLTYGRFAIPAAAALITATSRARLLAIMKGLDAVYWDTDSVFIKDYNPVTANEKLKVASSWLPPFLIPLRIGEELGELDCELENATGYLAGTKRYYLSDKEGYVKNYNL